MSCSSETAITPLCAGATIQVTQTEVEKKVEKAYIQRCKLKKARSKFIDE